MDYSLAKEKIKQIINQSATTEVLKNVIDFLYDQFEKYSWIGIYVVKGDSLILDPWKGEQATEHTKIPIGKGICGSAAQTGKTEIIDDVSSDKRYLACFVSTRSEIVVPIKRNGTIVGEIDIDSDVPNAFNEIDKTFLERVANMIQTYIDY